MFKILDKTDGISHSINTLGKGMNPIILPPARFFSLGEATTQRDGNSEFEPVLTLLKN